MKFKLRPKPAVSPFFVVVFCCCNTFFRVYQKYDNLCKFVDNLNFKTIKKPAIYFPGKLNLGIAVF